VDISPKEVESVRVIGRLFDNDVKMVKTLGGFHIAVGKKKKKNTEAEALAGGSHQAIVAHQLSKEFGSDFQPAIFKSEQDRLEDVEEKSQYLPSDQIKKGVELFTLTKSTNINFILYKHGVTLGEYIAEAEGGELVVKSYRFNHDMGKPDKGTAEAISRAMRDELVKYNLSRVILEK